MKNLKRTLCLVLAVVMCLGFAAMASAVDFTDQEEINYPEAVDVLSGIGVINGIEQDDGTFKFDPQGTLTRAQAAKIIAYLVGADTITGTAPFDDCKGHWAESNIAYCASEGIVNGVGDNKFDPNGTLKGYQFAKMLLGILGYDAKAEGMEGSGFEINTAKLIKKTNLTAGIKGFDGTKELTREEACQMALNLLQTKMVEYDGGINITAGDVTISADASRYELDKTFMEEYFPKLNKDPEGIDEDYRPAVVWTNGTEVLGIYPQEPAKIIIVKAADKGKKVSALLDANKLTVDTANYEGVPLDFTVSTGMVGEFFAGSDGKIVKGIGYMYEAVEIEGVKPLKKTTDADIIKAGATVKYTTSWGGSSTVYVDKLDGEQIQEIGDKYVYAIGTWEEGDVLACKFPSANPEFEKLEPVEGKISAYNTTSGSFTLGGTKYDLAAAFDTNFSGNPNFKDEYKLYLDPNGFALYLKAPETAPEAVNVDDVVYVVGVSGPGVDDEGNEIYYIKTLDMKGEYKLIKSAGKWDTDDYTISDGYFYVYNAKKDTFEYVSSYSSSAEIAYDYVNGKVTPSSKSLPMVYAPKAYPATDIKYVFVEKSGGAYKSATAYDSVTYTFTGYEPALIVKEGDNWIVKAVFVDGKYEEAGDEEVVYLTGKTGDVTANGTEYKGYALNGEPTTLVFKDAPSGAGFYKYTAEADGTYTLGDKITTFASDPEKDGNFEVSSVVASVYNNMFSAGALEDVTLADEVVIVDLANKGIDTIEDLLDYRFSGNIIVAGKKVTTIFVMAASLA